MHKDVLLGEPNPKYRNIILLHTDKFPVYCEIRISALSTWNIFIKLHSAVKQTFSTKMHQRSTDVALRASYLGATMSTQLGEKVRNFTGLEMQMNAFRI